MRAPLMVTGGHAAAHAPVHADVVPWSASNAYTVKPRPVVKIVPSAVCRSASTAPAVPPAWVAGLGDGAAPYRHPTSPEEQPPAAITASTATAASGLGSRPRARGRPKNLIIVPTSFPVSHARR